MDEGCMMKSDTLETAESRTKSERRRACLDQLYEQQLKDLHINCYDVEEQLLSDLIIRQFLEGGCRFYCLNPSDIGASVPPKKKHNPDSPFLLGEFMPEDVIHDAEQFSWIDRQQFIFEKTV